LHVKTGLFHVQFESLKVVKSKVTGRKDFVTL